MKNKIELKTRKSIGERSVYARCEIQFITRFVLAIDELFS